MDNNLITIATFNNPIDAHLALMKLENAGIQAVIFDENVGSLLSITVGGIKLKTRESDSEMAVNVLKEIQ